MADNYETQQLELEGVICGLSLDDLKSLAEYVELEVVEEDRRLSLTKKIRAKIENELETQNTSEKNTYLKELQSAAAGKPPPLEGEETKAESSETTAKEILEAKEEYEKLQAQFKLIMEQQENQLKKAEEKIATMQTNKTDKSTKEPTNETKITSEAGLTPPNPITIDVSKILKREFKITGSISGEGHKDRLSFVSLVRQIKLGLSNGYKESEVVEAVIRAISPSLKLRSYLEMMPNLSVSKLEQILKSHYKQKSGTELYQELTTMCQDPKESPQDFLIRAMDLRQQVIFASQAEDGPVKYDSGLVNALCRHVIETGLQDETVRAKLRPLLEKEETSDEQLMEKVNVAVSQETERASKLGPGPQKTVKTTKIQSVSSHDGSSSVNASVKDGEKKDVNVLKQDKLVATLEAVQADLAALRGEFKTSQEKMSKAYASSSTREPNRTERPRCKTCKNQDQSICNHCFKCGSAGHFARGCRNQCQAGNQQRLHPRDRE
jgi:hypothetical protein